MPTRRHIIKSGLLAVGGLALGGLALSKPRITSAAPARYGIVGKTAPELEIDYWIDKDGSSSSFSLAANKGKWVFLKCFQSWCPGCHAHGLPALKKMSHTLKDNPMVAFAGIQTVFEGFSVNTVEKVREIQRQYDLQIPMGHDPGHRGGQPTTMIDYRTGGTPWMILIDPQQRVVFNDYSINADKAIEFLVKRTS